jgi:putative transposase
MIGISPKRIQVVYQLEFTTKDLDIWANENNINLAFSRAEQPMNKLYIELFNGSFRYDCLNVN